MKYLDALVLKAKRRKCNHCGNSWFVDSYLENRSRIQGAVGDLASIGSGGVTRMAAMSAANTARAGLQENCPSCGAKDYSESFLLYTGAKPPIVPEPIGPCPLCRKPVSIEARKCPNCTGDIDQSESAKMKAAYAEAEAGFSKTQELLQERLKVQKGLRRRTNATVLIGLIGIVIGGVFVVSMINSLDLNLVMYGCWGVLFVYIVAVFSASFIERRRLVRYATEQEGRRR